ncbi:MAG TPA: single-stranded DNA-binding protein [Actinophytocola sp.]|jgi:single-strand DNA-binding protein|uniref:single-stranded DNA-binding protein n=1 Tax=Actinophytocola sp. TaxID=1872138 RepID=UPI002E0BEE34|nr:single-stranded DNA-binding protein [Actinophytocola sp.]
MFETPLTVVGRVISDINQRTTQSGDKVCSFRVVANERKFNRENNEWVDGDHVYVRVTCWRKLAENVSVSLFKGDHVVVTGRLYVSQYEVNGEPRSSLELDARAVGPNLIISPVMIGRAARDHVPVDALTRDDFELAEPAAGTKVAEPLAA